MRSRKLAPFLILFATLLFLVQGVISRWSRAHHPERPSRARFVAISLVQFGVAIYGGYFGAGIGILMLAALGFLGLSDIHAMNGLKNFFGMCVNAVAAALLHLSRRGRLARGSPHGGRGDRGRLRRGEIRPPDRPRSREEGRRRHRFRDHRASAPSKRAMEITTAAMDLERRTPAFSIRALWARRFPGDSRRLR